MNFPTQNHKTSLSNLSKKYNVSIRTISTHLKSSGITKTREQYEADAKIRRETAYKLRQSGLKFKEIAEQLNISVNNAQQLVRRYSNS
ncbi:sigma factor-like helix-turn-helix DNA-binding protein [Ursidibacter arcticus]